MMNLCPGCGLPPPPPPPAALNIGKDKIDILQTSVKKLEQEIVTLRSDVDSMKAAAVDSKKTSDELKKNLEKQSKEVEKLTKKVEQLGGGSSSKTLEFIIGLVLFLVVAAVVAIAVILILLFLGRLSLPTINGSSPGSECPQGKTAQQKVIKKIFLLPPESLYKGTAYSEEQISRFESFIRDKFNIPKNENYTDEVKVAFDAKPWN